MSRFVCYIYQHTGVPSIPGTVLGPMGWQVVRQDLSSVARALVEVVRGRWAHSAEEQSGFWKASWRRSHTSWAGRTNRSWEAGA